MNLRPSRTAFLHGVVRMFAVCALAGIAASAGVAQTPPARKTGSAASPVTNATVEAGSLHAQGKVHFDKRDYAKAIELYSKAIGLSPAYADAWYDRGVARMNKGDFQISVTDFTQAIDLYGKSGAGRQQGVSYVDRARALTRLDKTADALLDFERARQYLANSPQLYAYRAFTNWRARKLDDAMADTGRVLVLEPNSAVGYLARGIRGLVHLDRKHYDAAAAEFRSLLSAAPDQRTAIAGLRSNLTMGRGDQPMTIRVVRLADPACEPECPEWIAMQGIIERGTDSQLVQVLDKLGAKRLPVLIDSPGGNVEAALAMGRKIRERDLDVATARTEFAPACVADPACSARPKGGRALGTASDIASLCSSSCAYILSAGGHRNVGPLSLVGVHQIMFYKVYKEPPSDEQLRKDRAEGRVIISTPSGPRLLGAVKDAAYVQSRTYYRDMDIDDTIMGYLLGAPANGMHWFTADQLVATRLMTGTGFVGQFLDGKGLVPSVVTLAAPKASAVAGSSVELAESLNRELLRVGCLTAGTDEKATPATLKRGLARYSALTGRTFADGPTQVALDTLRRQSGTICPETCPRGTSERDGYCVKAATGN